MNKILVIAEKPSVGRDIAKVLKCKTKGEGFLYSDKHIVSWAIGHLVTLYDPQDYNTQLKSWDINTLPIIPKEIKLKPILKTKKQLSILKKLMNSKEVNSIICATDSGREGELIFRYIYEIVNCKKPFKRLWISSMTDTAIKEGLNNIKLGQEYDNLYYSARCRSEADWLVGINATRAYTLKYNSLLSIGRVQTPTLGIMVERQKEINAFVAEEYFEVIGIFEDYKGTWFNYKDKESKIKTKEEANAISNKVKNKVGYIFDIEKEEKQKLPPLLYDLTQLQKDCNRYFGFSAQKTLGIAQDLYEKRKLITYPRTDSQYLSDDMIPKIYSTLKRLDIKPYNEYINFINSLSKLPLSKRIVDKSKVTDHHAIIPSDNKINISLLTKDEYNVYNLIVKRFIAVFYPNYIYSITRIITKIEEEHFITKGTTILKLGWMELYKNDKNKKEEQNGEDLPNVSKKDNIKVINAEVLKKKTSPPKLYTESTLLSAMENAGRFTDNEELKSQLKESGIGTPATRASIIERLIKVGYIQRKGRTLIPTDKGMKLIEVVPKELKSTETTGKWEKGLTSISKGKMDKEKFMESINRYVNYIVNTSNAINITVEFPKEQKKANMWDKNLGVCPSCQKGNILENSKAYYCSSWKSGCKYSIWKNFLDIYGVKLDKDIIKKLLLNEKIENMQIILPQTREMCIGTLILKNTNNPPIEFININRI